jgi:hypothetical protein
MKDRHRLRIAGLSLSFLVALALLVLLPAGVLAAGTQRTPSWSIRTGAGAPGASGAIVASTYPADCIKRSDYPHLGKYSNYTAVDAKGWVICSVQRPREHVESTLYRQDCVWFICWLTQVGFDSKTGPPQWFAYGQVRAVPSHTCNGSSSHYYEIDSYHELTDFDGTIWYAYTSNSATIPCG